MGEKDTESRYCGAQQSPDVERSELRIRQNLIRIRNLGLRRAHPGESELLSALEFELFGENSSFPDFALHELGIYVAGFLYLQHDEHLIRYQFFGQTEGKEDPGYMVPYLWPEEKNINLPSAADRPAIAAAAIDSLFWVQRQCQSPWFPIAVRDHIVDPLLPAEFVSALPFEQKADDRKASLTTPGYGYGWHYCEYGAMIYHLYVWRLFIRYLMARQGGLTVRGSEFDPNTHWSFVGNRLFPLLDPSCDLGGLESRFAGALSHEWDDRIDPKKQDSLSISQRLIQRCETSETSGTGWWADWNRLLLVNQFEGDSWSAGPALEPLLRYLKGRHESLFNDLEPRMYRMKSLGHSALMPLDELLRTAAMRDYETFLPSLSESVNASYLVRLHERASFPIIPYFYWNWIDRTPKTHMVVPVWYSFSNPGQVTIQSQPEVSMRSYISAVCVVGLAPLGPEHDATIPSDPRHELHDQLRKALRPSTFMVDGMAQQRTDLLAGTLRDFSTPQINQVYEVEMEGVRQLDRVRRQVSQDLSHNLDYPLRLLKAIISDPSGQTPSDAIFAKSLDWLTDALITEKALLQLAGQTPEQVNKHVSAQNATARILTSARCSLTRVFHMQLARVLVGVCYSDDFGPSRQEMGLADKQTQQLACTHFLQHLEDEESIECPKHLQFQDWPRIETTFSGPHVCFRKTGNFPDGQSAEGYLEQLLKFWINELVLNTFRHQYRPYGRLAKGEVLFLGVHTQLCENLLKIYFRFGPLPPLTLEATKTRGGLKSLQTALKYFGYRSIYSAMVDNELRPYFRDVDGAREWGIEGIDISHITIIEK